MIRLWNMYLPGRLFTFIALDGAAVFLLGLMALHPGFSRHVVYSWHSIAMAMLIGAVLLWCLYLFDLYDLDARSGWHDTFTRGVRALGVAALLLAPAWWFFAPNDVRYSQVEVSLIVFLVIFCLYRFTVESMRRVLRRGERVLLVGHGPKIDLLASALEQRLSLPLLLSGIVSPEKASAAKSSDIVISSDFSDLEALCEKLRPNRIALALDRLSDAVPPSQLLALRRRGIRVEDATSLYEALCGRVPVNELHERSLAFGHGFQRSAALSRLYRFGGFLVTLCILIVLLPLFALLALLIKLDSSGPVFYRQERVGLNGKTFRVVKFRSMRADAEKLSGPVWASEKDPRITRMGRILRKTRLDEFAQILNVMRGEMCLVGPRPERPHFTAMLAEKIPFYDLRHSIPPGITGWAQVCAGYGSTVDESRVKLEYDLFYVKNENPLLDALILFKTVKIALFGRGAR